MVTLARLTIHELHQKLVDREISATELTKEHLETNVNKIATFCTTRFIEGLPLFGKYWFAFYDNAICSGWQG